jgi:hypothetical protein
MQREREYTFLLGGNCEKARKHKKEKEGNRNILCYIAFNQIMVNHTFHSFQYQED